MSAGWSLRRRIERWCLVLGTAFVSLLALFGCVIVYRETNRELEAIAKEELEEMIGGFATSRGSPEDFQIVSATLQRSHPDDPMAWRVWRVADGSEWIATGPERLLALLPTDPAVTPAVRRTHRYERASMGDEFQVALLLEGGREVASERLFFLTAGASVLLAALFSYLAGRFLGARIGTALEDIAADTRASVGSDAAPETRPNLPHELADVAAALRESLACVRAESERTRLLAAGLAHELRSPLQNLRLQAEVSLLRPRAVEEYVEAMHLQLHDLVELIRAVDNLVNLCAPPEARRARQAETFDLAAELRLRLESERARALRSRQELVLTLPETLALRGDRETLVLALRNLVVNALDWSPAHGRVELRLFTEGASWVAEVDDQGPGVPEQQRERIFRPFERGGPRPDGRIGYGLGLALVRTVAEAHGGTIEVGSAPGGGARFRLVLPHASS